MSVLETILIYVLIPLVVYGVITLLARGFKSNTRPRYRPGAEWNYPPVWWTANPAALPGVHGSHEAAASEDGATIGHGARGGARGRW